MCYLKLTVALNLLFKLDVKVINPLIDFIRVSIITSPFLFFLVQQTTIEVLWLVVIF